MPSKVDFSNGVNNMITDFMSGRTAMIFDGPSDVSRSWPVLASRAIPVTWGSLLFQRAPLDRPAHRSVGSRMSSLLAQRILMKRTSSFHS